MCNRLDKQSLLFGTIKCSFGFGGGCGLALFGVLKGRQSLCGFFFFLVVVVLFGFVAFKKPTHNKKAERQVKRFDVVFHPSHSVLLPKINK